MISEPIDRVRFDASELIREHPPRWMNRNKEMVFELSSSPDYPFKGNVVYARWPESELPDSVTGNSGFSICPDVFTYGVNVSPGIVEWHMNFADPSLFAAYGSSLLAQDELQVLEHPVLGSLRDALSAMRKPCGTVNSSGRPTPVTITGVQRRCAFDTQPNEDEGRPEGLYGNAFARASVEDVVAATKPLSPPTITNILAIAAPACGFGNYTIAQIRDVVCTAYSGFLAARIESGILAPSSSKTVIHTGFWGCGAFGGNRSLMTVLQSLSADLAGVDIVFHSLDEAKAELVGEARELYASLRGASSSVPHILDAIAEQGFCWGESDGN